MKIFTFFLMFLCPVIIFSQELKLNKKIKSTADFEHTISGISAPMNLGSFSRADLFTNSKNDSVFAAEYEDRDNNLVFKFKVLPAFLDEERLLSHYYKDLQERKYSPKENEKISKAVTISEGKFKLHGISSYFSHLDRLINLRVAQDKLLLRTTMSSATNKMKWIYENIDKYQRAAGIPGILLDFQIAGINGFIDYKTEKNQSTIEGNNPTTQLISFFTKLRKDGFVDEYLMEQYYYLLIPPGNHQFDYTGYQKWKQENSIEYNTSQKYYLIVNSRKKTDLNKDE